eukprot:3620972-Rhodomonas_salina.1
MSCVSFVSFRSYASLRPLQMTCRQDVEASVPLGRAGDFSGRDARWAAPAGAGAFRCQGHRTSKEGQPRLFQPCVQVDREVDDDVSLGASGTDSDMRGSGGGIDGKTLRRDRPRTLHLLQPRCTHGRPGEHHDGTTSVFEFGWIEALGQVFSLTEAVGGQVFCESEQGKGSTFGLEMKMMH